MKKMFAMMLAFVMMFSLTACAGGADSQGTADATSTAGSEAPAGSTAAVDGDAVKAVMISVMAGGTYWGPIEEGWLDTCKSYGWQGEYWTPVTTNSQTEMIELAESAITQGYKILCVCGTDANMWADVLGRAKEAGCIVLGVAADMGPELLECCVGPEYYTMGYQCGQYMAEMMNADGVPECNYFSIQTAYDSGQNDQRQGFLDALNEYFDGPVNDLGTDTNDSSVSIAQDKLNAMYLVHPEMNAYYGVETYAMVAGASFVEEHGLQGKFYCATPDAAPENLQLMLDGIYTQGGQLDCYGEGTSCAEAAKLLLEGGKPEQHYIPVALTMYDATTLKEHLEEFGVAESDLTWPE